ncbi:uncharacterized protein LOC107369060 [Tetranychus urticae]|uniref:Secreted protein n=1 Tax=Tetranychus urticae TaxID=32264 RepID=T1L0N6_TETUR|nr:uncharacterized protein LOC107369060 [Tetranychus urticae]
MKQLCLIILSLSVIFNCTDGSNDIKDFKLFCGLLELSGKIEQSKELKDSKCFTQIIPKQIQEKIFKCYGDLITTRIADTNDVCLVKKEMPESLRYVVTCLHQAFDELLIDVVNICIQDELERVKNQQFESLFISK